MTRKPRLGIKTILGLITGLLDAIMTARPLRFGIHGIMSAGKTSFQTVLFLKRTFAGGRLSYHDTRTIEYLRKTAAFLKENGKTPSTIQGNPDRLLYDLIVGAKTYSIEATDYSGALADAGTPEALDHLVQGVVTFNVRSDALLLFVDASSQDENQLDALNVLLKHLTSVRSPLGSPRRPIAIIWTKIDRLTRLDSDPMTVERHVRQQLRDHEVFQTVDQLRDTSDRPFILKNFFVSVYGYELPEGQVVAKKDLKPFNIYVPIIWAAGQATRVVASRRQKRTWAQPLGSWPVQGFLQGFGKLDAITLSGNTTDSSPIIRNTPKSVTR